jgi:predicted deacylase
MAYRVIHRFSHEHKHIRVFMNQSEIYPVELSPVDISAYRQGNVGVDYVHRFDSNQPGPCVMISALVHGNELCGAIALDYLLKQQIRPLRGSLILAFVNVAAYQQFDPANPRVTRFVDEDFNRLWSTEVLQGERDSVELQRARELRPIVDTVDLLLDLHSMHHLSVPLGLAGILPKGRQLARQVGLPAVVIADAGHRAGVRLRDYGGFGDPASPKNALLVECGQHWQAQSAETAIAVAFRFLDCLQLIDSELARQHSSTETSSAQTVVQVTQPVTVQTDSFRFAQPYVGLEVIPEAGTVIGYDGDTPIVTPYDNCVLVMPSFYLQPGDTAVRFGRLLEN